ncbi:hypothetical protein [Kingella denitrificans]|uniref:hypothetical protein n=1 Tax=Kingella denitrificans TaxID=502 RepID=UPI00288A307B|nr:hypothetical protein [Kingella denitrificans]
MADKTPLQKARAKYAAKSTNKTVSFNHDTEQALLDFAQSLPNFGSWVKEQIKVQLKQGNK